MQNIKQLLLIVGAALLLAGCGGGGPDSIKNIAKNKEVRMTTEAQTAPFELGEGTGCQGFGADIGEEVAKAAGFPFRCVPIKTNGVDHLLDAFREGTSDDMVISSVINDPRRSAEFDYSMPYYDTGDVIAHHRDDFDITDLASLSGKKVGVVAGRPADVFMTSQATAANVTLSKYSSIDEALSSLTYRQIDAVVGDEILLIYSSIERPNTNILSDIINRYSYAVAVRKGDAEFLSMINDTITRMRDSGELKQLEDKWIGDVKERAEARASADREQEELRRAPKAINVTINKLSGSGNWSMDILDGFQFVLKGESGTFRSTYIQTDGNTRGNCRFSTPVPPGNYTLDISILGVYSVPVRVPEVVASSLPMSVNIGSTVTITF